MGWQQGLSLPSFLPYHHLQALSATTGITTMDGREEQHTRGVKEWLETLLNVYECITTMADWEKEEKFYHHYYFNRQHKLY